MGGGAVGIFLETQKPTAGLIHKWAMKIYPGWQGREPSSRPSVVSGQGDQSTSLKSAVPIRMRLVQVPPPPTIRMLITALGRTASPGNMQITSSSAGGLPLSRARIMQMSEPPTPGSTPSP